MAVSGELTDEELKEISKIVTEGKNLDNLDNYRNYLKEFYWVFLPLAKDDDTFNLLQGFEALDDIVPGFQWLTSDQELSLEEMTDLLKRLDNDIMNLIRQAMDIEYSPKMDTAIRRLLKYRPGTTSYELIVLLAEARSLKNGYAELAIKRFLELYPIAPPPPGYNQKLIEQIDNEISFLNKKEIEERKDVYMEERKDDIDSLRRAGKIRLEELKKRDKKEVIKDGLNAMKKIMERTIDGEIDFDLSEYDEKKVDDKLYRLLEILSRGEDKKLGQLLGPVNAWDSIVVEGNDGDDHDCIIFGGCRMWLCRCNEKDEEDGTLPDDEENSDHYDWYYGACDRCASLIPDRRRAIRAALPTGTWMNEYCSDTCMVEHLKYEISHVTTFTRTCELTAQMIDLLVDYEIYSLNFIKNKTKITLQLDNSQDQIEGS